MLYKEHNSANIFATISDDKRSSSYLHLLFGNIKTFKRDN